MATDERAVEILAEWRAARDRGQAVDSEELIRQNPDQAEALRRGLAAEALLEQAVLEAGRSAEGPFPRPPLLGDYRVLREVGRGGMGIVYEAEQVSMRRRVALKVLYPSVTLDPRAIERFRREAQAAGRLHHTNIVAVHGMGSEAGTWFYAMDLVDGRPLSQVLDDVRHLEGTATEPSPSETASGITATGGRREEYARLARSFAGLADALATAHAAGVIHRDVKPANILLDQAGRLRLVDFGLARVLDDGAAITRSGDVVGTPAYMSPEQARSGAVDARSDVYSLGATLYEVVTRHPPFEGSDVAEVMRGVLTGEPPPPRRWNRRIPRDLETVVLKAIEREPARRYAAAADLARDLITFAEGGAIRARRIGPLGRAWRVVRRHRVRAALAVSTVVLAALSWWLFQQRAAEEQHRIDREYAGLLMPTSLDDVAGPPEGHPEEADARIERLTRAISLAPDRPEAWLQRAIRRGTDLAASLADLDAARTRGLPEGPYRWARAHVYLRLGYVDEAAGEERLATALAAEDPESLSLQARVAGHRGETARALALLAQLLRVAHPHTAAYRRALLAGCNVRERVGDLEGALQDALALRTLLGPGAKERGLEVFLASLWKRMGRGEAAETHLKGLMEEASRAGSAAPWIKLADACAQCLEPDWQERVVAQGLAAHPDSVDLRLQHADFGSPAEALAIANRILQDHPELHGGQCRRATALMNLGRAEEALAESDRALASLDSCGRAIVAKSWALARLGRAEESRTTLAEALRRRPLDDRLLDAAVVANLGCARAEDALLLLDGAIAVSPGRVWLHERRAVVLLALARYREAEAAARRALALDPRRVDAHQVLQSSLLRQGLLDDALASAQEALRLRPGDPNATGTLAAALRLQGRPEQALEVLSRVGEPSSWETRFQRMEAYRALGRHEDVLRECEGMLGEQPQDAHIQSIRGAALLALGRPAQAAEALEAALAAPVDRSIDADAESRVLLRTPSPSSPRWGVRVNLSTALMACGRDQEALLQLEEAGREAPDEVAVHNNRGNALVRLGRYEEALQAYERVLQLDPRSAAAEAVIASILQGAYRRYDDAIVHAERALALDASNPTAHLVRALCLEAGGRSEEAFESLTAALAGAETMGAGTTGQIWYVRAVVLHNLGRSEEARDSAERAIHLHPEAAGPRQILGCVLTALHQPEAGLAAMDEAARLRGGPGSRGDQTDRGRALLEAGRSREAVSIFETLLETGEDALFLAALSRVAVPNPTVGEAEAALRLAERLVAHEQGSAESLRILAGAHCATGDAKTALQTAKQARRLGGDSPLDDFLTAWAEAVAGRADRASEALRMAVQGLAADAQPDLTTRLIRSRAEALLAR